MSYLQSWWFCRPTVKGQGLSMLHPAKSPSPFSTLFTKNKWQNPRELSPNLSMSGHKLALQAVKCVQATLASERDALINLSDQYLNRLESQMELLEALQCFHDTVLKGGKIVCVGVGKSFKIATKTVATMKSLSIRADILHPTEALHGDLGLIGENDCLLFFTASGNTPELMALLPHVSPHVPIVLLSCNRHSDLADHPQVKYLIQVELPEHLKESSVHGLPAPTVSATLQLVMADSVVLALAEMIESDRLKRRQLFSRMHPGGSIGSDLSHLNGTISAPTSAPSTSPRSYSSSLSLNQLRDCMGNISLGMSHLDLPPSSQDSDNLSVDSASAVSSIPRITIQNKVETFDLQQIKSWTESEFFKAITINDYILFHDQKKNAYSCKSTDLRSWYRSQVLQGVKANQIFEQISKQFHPTSIDS